MSDDSKSFEKKLDRDFLYYLNLTKTLFANIKNDSARQLCEVWLTHLFGKTISSVAEKCDRNIYLSRLLLQMQSGKLKGVFLDTPPSGTLPCAFTTFGLPTEIDGLKGFEELGFQVDSTVGGSGDFLESSRDGRTYLATRHLPRGIMAYIAVTNNEGEPVWMPQTCPTSIPSGTESKVIGICEKKAEGYTRKLLDYIEVPMCQLRKSPEEREQVMEWMDKMINDCNKWIQGEDPHNMELEVLFEELFEAYKEDPENVELLQHPKTVRTILFRDIRDKIYERRAEVSKREMILDQYESEQYVEERDQDDSIDDVWLECAKKPLSNSVKFSLEANYPPEVIQRFTELLFQERLLIIRKGERRAKKKISELRRSSIEETKSELQRLKKAQDDYKEYYGIYKEIEEKGREIENDYKLMCLKTDQMDPQLSEKMKQDMEAEIQQAKRNLDKEVKTKNESEEKLEETKEAFRKMKECFLAETDKLNCKVNQLRIELEDLQGQICILKRKKEEMKCKIQSCSKQCQC